MINIGGNVEVRPHAGYLSMRCEFIYSEWIEISPRMFHQMEIIANYAFGVTKSYAKNRTSNGKISVSVHSENGNNFLRLGIFSTECIREYILISYHMFCNMKMVSEQVWGVWRESDKLKLYEWDGRCLLT